MSKIKHYVKTPVRGKDKRVSEYTTQCGMTKPWNEVVKANTIGKVNCAECILSLMTSYEEKICMLEERYETLFPNRPVGEKLQ